jgi:hypothetical protein
MKHSKNKAYSMIVSAVVAFGLSACASSNLVPVFEKPTADVGEAQIIIVREDAGSGQDVTPVSVFVGGVYHTALLPGGFTKINTCANKETTIQSITGLPQARQHSDTMANNSYTLQKSQTLLFKLGAVDAVGNVSLVALPVEDAAKWAVNRQSHLISRVRQSVCN